MFCLLKISNKSNKIEFGGMRKQVSIQHTQQYYLVTSFHSLSECTSLKMSFYILSTDNQQVEFMSVLSVKWSSK